MGAQLFSTQILAPQEDVGAILTIVQGPTGATLPFMEKQTRELAKILNKVPEKEALGIINGFMGVNSAISFLILKPWNERHRGMGEIIGSLFPQLWGSPASMLFLSTPIVSQVQKACSPLALLSKRLVIMTIFIR